jgi:RNA polymerase sigma factor (sigma-70 family)
MSALPAPETHAESYAAALYQRHNAAVFRHCLKQLRRREDADDAMQTTFVYALLSLRRGVVPQAELAWLFTIASNVCSTNRRAWARRGPLAAAQDVDALHDVIPTPDRNVPVTADEFRAALTSMPDAQRRALLLREWRGLSYSEIADRLGLTQSATETLLFRARRTLARRLEEKAGAGFSIAAFVRSALQSGAAKTIAVGLGATAIAVTPSAEPRAHAPLQRERPAVVSPQVAATPQPKLRQPRTVVPTQHVAKITPAVATQTPREEIVEAPEQPSPQPATAPASQESTAPPAAPEPTPQPRPEPAPTATDSVVPEISVPPLPPVPLPPVEIVVPPLPKVELPAVTLPPLLP